ncbi:hypothetical protein HYALB_00013830 [Hymenoscyphus albidus]|uniref:Uncharacterized protein n=1 Tax=Hymenoscyphus albidus TaxID=595503 RepID=A0A9N9Q6G6_9HELO|nr:hypothetical protein HYALB_00013830 [Hymenoscyphus albidus]
MAWQLERGSADRRPSVHGPRQPVGRWDEDGTWMDERYSGDMSVLRREDERRVKTLDVDASCITCTLVSILGQ